MVASCPVKMGARNTVIVVLSFGLRECQSFVLIKAPPWLTFSVCPSIECEVSALDSFALKNCLILTCFRLSRVVMGSSSFLPPKLASYQVFETDHFVRFKHDNANSIPYQHKGQKM